MKIQITPQSKQNSKNQNYPKAENQNPAQTSFKGAEAVTWILNGLQTNQAIGATFVDAAFMCTPRTAVDFTRGPDAGIETARREFSSNINDALLGIYGAGAAAIISTNLNKQFGVKANEIYADGDFIDVLADIKGNRDLRDPENLKTCLQDIFKETKAFNPNSAKCDNTGLVPISENTQKELVEKIHTSLIDEKKNPQPKYKILSNEWKAQKKANENFQNTLKSILLNDTGTEDYFKLERTVIGKDGKNQTKTISVPIKDYLDSIQKLLKTFMSDEVESAFKEGKGLDNKFIKKFKNTKIGTAALGLAICAGIGAATQPINMYLTKKKTGKSGFVGGGKEDKSTEFKLLKIGVGLAAAAAAVATITTKPSKFLSKIQFKGILPTLDQFKLVYGITIVSRLLSARNDNELRESSIKDSLGFANWLILGGFVSKATALAVENIPKFANEGIKFTKFNAAESGKKPKWLAASILSREEVLQNAFKEAGISTIKNGKAMSLMDMLKDVAKLPNAKAIKSKLKFLSLIQFAGYAWSGLVLGIGIPKLNIAITKSIEKKRQEKEAAESQKIAA